MIADEENVQLPISVGGTKCELAAVGVESGRFLARSGRVEWVGLGVSSFAGFVDMVASQLKSLLNVASIQPARVVHIGVAWPGPQVGNDCLATFIPGGNTPQPFAALLQAAMAKSVDERFRTVPVTVRLDAIARATGESLPGGSLFRAPGGPTKAGILVNLATGIAGGIVHGSPLLSAPGIGENYGQFGRFLFFHRGSETWDWRPSADGTVASHGPDEIRWTHLSAGPALASRFGRWAAENGVRAAGAPAEVREAFAHFAAPNALRHTVLERMLLVWITAEANRAPTGPVAEFVCRAGAEIGGALRLLLGVFSAYPIDRVILAGGVGENFGRADSADCGVFLDSVRETLARGDCLVARARLGVEAELLGFTPPAGKDVQ